MLISTAFVFFMTPGLAFFYGGLVRRKNVCSTMMACVAIMGLSVAMWSLFGYSLSFGGITEESSGISDGSDLTEWEWSRAHTPDDPSSGVLRLSDDVRYDHAGAHYRSPGRENEV